MKYSNVYKIKAERCEMMEYIKKIALYMSVLLLIILLGMWKYERRTEKEANTNKTDSKKSKSKKLLRKRWICILLKI